MGRGGARPGAGRKSRAEEISLQKLLAKCWTEKQRRECINQQVERAMLGDLDAFKILMAYTYGRPKQHHEITGADGEPLFKSYVGIDTDQV